MPWVFAPLSMLAIVRPELKGLFPDSKATDLESVLPWLYCTYDRKPEAQDEAKEERPDPVRVLAE
jgi:hypothetical protein